MRAAAVLVCAGVGVATGCFGNSATEFPPGLEPLEANSAPVTPGRDPVEALTMVEGSGYNAAVDRDYVFVHGRAYIAASPALVWRLTKSGERMSASCRIDSWSVTQDIDAAYEYSFRVANSVDDVVNVDWQEEWRYGTVEGTPAAPEFGMVRYQKTYGSDFIYLIEGSIQIHATGGPELTEIDFVEHLAALAGDVNDIRNTMTRRFALLLAAAHDQPEPACP